MFDCIVKQVKLRGRKNPVDIAVSGDTIAEIGERIDAPCRREIDGAGHMTCPPFIDPHLHLDAVFSVGAPRYNMSGSHLEGIEVWGEYKKNLTAETIRENALRAVRWEAANGVQWIRTHADVTDPRLTTLKALLQVREEVRDLMDIQIVAFPQDGVFTRPPAADYPGGDTLMRKAVEMGADVIGGIPHCEYTREEGIRDVEFAFDLAEKYDLLVDIHCDETGDEQSRFIETMAACAIHRGMEGRAAASHATAMHNYNNDYAAKLIGILKRADLAVITNPFDNSVLQNRHDGYPRRRGHARVDELADAGVTVSIGHDSIMDPWYPLGKGSMPAAANLLLHTAHLSGNNQVELLFDMITRNSARVLSVSEEYGIEEGKPASFIILDASSELQALRLMPEILYSFRKGKIVARSTPAKRSVRMNDVDSEIDFTIPGRDI